jgi:hypothetical protein
VQLGPTGLFDRGIEGPAFVIENATRAIGNLCRVDHANSKIGDVGDWDYTVHRHGGCEAVVAVMKTLVKSLLSRPYLVEDGDSDVRVRITKQCMVVMGNVANRGDVYVNHLGSLGCCEITLFLLKALASHQRLVEMACAAIGNYAHSDENRLRIADAEGCALLISVLQRHRKSEVIVQLICMALYNLSLNNKIRSGLLAIHADEEVEKVLRGFPVGSKVFLEARDTLLRIGETDFGCSASAPSGGEGKSCAIM